MLIIKRLEMLNNIHNKIKIWDMLFVVQYIKYQNIINKFQSI